jgi:hypothetical protein
VASGGLAILVRAHDRPFVPEWVSEISHTRLDLRAIAFDPQDNPVVLGMDRNHPGGSMRLVKLDLGSGKILGDGYFGTPWDEPAAMAVDGAGNVYITGRTRSAAFPLVAPESCGPPDSTGQLPCSFGFVTKVDASLQKVGVFHGAGDTRV